MKVIMEKEAVSAPGTVTSPRREYESGRLLFYSYTSGTRVLISYGTGEFVASARTSNVCFF